MFGSSKKEQQCAVDELIRKLRDGNLPWLWSIDGWPAVDERDLCLVTRR